MRSRQSSAWPEQRVLRQRRGVLSFTPPPFLAAAVDICMFVKSVVFCASVWRAYEVCTFNTCLPFATASNLLLRASSTSFQHAIYAVAVLAVSPQLFDLLSCVCWLARVSSAVCPSVLCALLCMRLLTVWLTPSTCTLSRVSCCWVACSSAEPRIE